MLNIVISDEQEYFIPIKYKSITRDMYEISNYGNIRNVINHKVMKQFISNSGYKRIGLNSEPKRKNYSVHVLVKFHFGEIIEKPTYQINHLDGNKFNNYYKNLEYCTQSVNITHAYDLGLMKKGKEHHLGKYDDELIHNICKQLELQYDIYTIISNITNNPNISRTSEKYIRLRSYIKKLRQKQFRKDIVKLYNFNKE